MQVQGLSDLNNISELEELVRFASIMLSSITDVVNGNLEFESNIKSQIVSVMTPAVAGTEFPVQHDLKKLRPYYMVIATGQATNIWSGETPTTLNTIYLKSNAQSETITILLF